MGSFTSLFIYRHVSLEPLMGDHSTEKFLRALQKIFDRQGKPDFIISDAAGEFVTGLGHLKYLSDHLQKLNMKYKLGHAPLNIKFHVSTYAPWTTNVEQIVRTVKSSLAKTMCRSRVHCYFNFDECLRHAEKVINMRPLTYLAEDGAIAKDEDVILTPFHLVQGRRYKNFDLDFSCFKTALTPLTFELKKKFKHRRELMEKFEKHYYKEYFANLSQRTKWFKDGNDDHIPKINDVVMVVENSNPKNIKGFKLGIITGIKRSRDASKNLATVHVKLCEGLSQRKQALKPHDCNICGPKSLCNLATSSRNLCLLERHVKKDYIQELSDKDNSNGNGKNSTVILLPDEAGFISNKNSGPERNNE